MKNQQQFLPSPFKNENSFSEISLEIMRWNKGKQKYFKNMTIMTYSYQTFSKKLLKQTIAVHYKHCLRFQFLFPCSHNRFY